MLQLILWNGQKKKFPKKIWKKNVPKKIFFSSLNIGQAKSGVQKIFSLPMGGGGGERFPKKEVAQNDAKHILVLEFLRSDHFVCGPGEGGGVHQKVNRHTHNQTDKQPTNPTDTIVSR